MENYNGRIGDAVLCAVPFHIPRLTGARSIWMKNEGHVDIYLGNCDVNPSLGLRLRPGDTFNIDEHWFLNEIYVVTEAQAGRLKWAWLDGVEVKS